VRKVATAAASDTADTAAGVGLVEGGGAGDMERGGEFEGGG
jgi:hypothetical protein